MTTSGAITISGTISALGGAGGLDDFGGGDSINDGGSGGDGRIKIEGVVDMTATAVIQPPSLSRPALVPYNGGSLNIGTRSIMSFCTGSVMYVRSDTLHVNENAMRNNDTMPPVAASGEVVTLNTDGYSSFVFNSLNIYAGGTLTAVRDPFSVLEHIA